jgi:hypothetical protein
MAIAFFWGDPFSETINNQSSLSLAMSEVIKYQNVSEDVPSVKVSCDSFIFYK